MSLLPSTANRRPSAGAGAVERTGNDGRHCAALGCRSLSRRAQGGRMSSEPVSHSIEELPVLLIEAHSRCNCRCVMCDIWKTGEHREFTMAQLEAQLDAIERLRTRWVVFTGGEPLMHSNLFALADLLRGRGIKVTILSTGLL